MVRSPLGRLKGSHGSRSPGFRNVPLAGAVLCACLLAGCSAMRYRLAGEEAGKAAAFFARIETVQAPVTASFSGTAEVRGRAFPIVAGIRSEGPSADFVGLYDLQGRAVLFLENRGGRLTVFRGPAAEEFPLRDLPSLSAGPMSIGRILAGLPGYPVTEGDVERTRQGAWVFRNDRQILVSDPEHRALARAEYDVSGSRISVTYPDRNGSSLPARVEVELPGTRIHLRRDAE